MSLHCSKMRYLHMHESLGRSRISECPFFFILNVRGTEIHIIFNQAWVYHPLETKQIALQVVSMIVNRLNEAEK